VTSLTACPVSAVLTLNSTGSRDASIRPCAYAGRGGAVLELSGGRLGIRTAQMQSGRGWTRPLYEKPPKRDRRQ
jgi:hypothetical protein